MNTRKLITKSQWCEHLSHDYHHQNSDALMIVLGGQNYEVTKPLLYYTVELGLQSGLDVLAVNYGFIQNPSKTHFPEDFEVLYHETKSVIDMALESRHKSLVFVGKSLGTVLIKRLKRDYAHLPHKIIFITPVSPAFDEGDFKEKLILMGTGDTHYDETLLNKEEESMIIEFDGADHSLETDNVFVNLQILERVLGAISGYLENDEAEVVL